MIEELRERLEAVLAGRGAQGLKQAREELSERYRTSSGKRMIVSDSERYSYLASRMPATYAAIEKALAWVKERLDLSETKSLLDLGAGPGTATWAACASLPIEKVYLIEKDPGLIALGKELKPSQALEWQQGDLERLPSFPTADLVIFSYAAGEINPSELAKIIDKAWEATGQLLLVIEPGTPAGFARIHAIREQLLGRGEIVAPCTHALVCPMWGSKEWCHFPARLERSSLHKQVKGGSLGYEDEKFSYVAFSKKKIEKAHGRIIHTPSHHSGHVRLKVCTEGVLKEEVISRKQGALYTSVKKSTWGDLIFEL